MKSLLLIIIFTYGVFFNNIAAQVKGTSLPMRIVTKDASRTSAGPRLTLIQPVLAGGQIVTVKEQKQRIVVEVLDKSGISEVRINDKKTASNDGKIFFSDINLKAGENIISISARNARGNSSVKIFNMTWLSTLAPPVISITSPLPGKGTKVIVSQDMLTIKGSTLSLNGIRLLTVNGQRAKLLEDGSFSAEAALANGDNALVIKATDTRGNTATDTFFVTHK